MSYWTEEERRQGLMLQYYYFSVNFAKGSKCQDCSLEHQASPSFITRALFVCLGNHGILFMWRNWQNIDVYFSMYFLFLIARHVGKHKTQKYRYSFELMTLLAFVEKRMNRFVFRVNFGFRVRYWVMTIFLWFLSLWFQPLILLTKYSMIHWYIKPLHGARI